MTMVKLGVTGNPMENCFPVHPPWYVLLHDGGPGGCW
jgi:hypothetical protein